MRIGHGYDVHRLVEGRKLILGGVAIPWEKGLLGHSDADVVAQQLAHPLAQRRAALHRVLIIIELLREAIHVIDLLR